MRVLFWGTPSFALPSLGALLAAGHEVAGVVTQPDRRVGRGRRRTRPSPVRAAAAADGIPAWTPERPRGEPFLEALRALEPEISVVVAYGHILAPEVLELPPRGSVNLHASLLPELRGAAPVNWAIARGHARTGVTVMRMTEGMDEGPILLQRALPIGEDDTASLLQGRLSELGAEALVEALARMEAGGLEPVEQDGSKASYAPKVNREVARIDWTREAREVANHIRGMDAVPGAWTLFGDRPVKLFGPRPRVGGPDSTAPAGTVLGSEGGAGLVVKTGVGSVRLAEAQPAGGRRMAASAWLRGGGPVPGDRLE